MGGQASTIINDTKQKDAPVAAEQLLFLKKHLELPDSRASGIFAEANALELGSQAVPLLKEGLNSKFPESRAFSAKILGLLSETTALPALTLLLQDKNPLVVDSVISAIGNLHLEVGVENLTPFLSAKDPLTRRSAIRALGNIRGTKAPAALIGELHKELLTEEKENAGELALAIGRSSKGESIRELLKFLSSPNKDLQGVAKTALSVAEDANLPAILRTLTTSKDSLVVESAIEIIGYRRIQELESTVAALLSSNKSSVVKAAVECLGRIGTDRSAEKLGEVAERNTSVTRSAYIALALVRTEKADEILRKFYTDGSDEIRKDIINSLSIARRVDWVEFFKQELKSSDLDGRQTALRALKNGFNNIEADEAIIEVGLSSQNETHLEAISRSIEKKRPNLEVHLNDTDLESRLMVAIHLLPTNKKAAEIMLNMASAGNPERAIVSMAANLAVMKEHGFAVQSEELVFKELNNPDWTKRRKIIFALKSAGQSGTEILLSGALSQNATVKSDCLSALASVNDDKAVAVVLENLSTFSEKERQRILNILKRNANVKAQAATKDFQSDSRKEASVDLSNMPVFQPTTLTESIKGVFELRTDPRTEYKDSLEKLEFFREILEKGKERGAGFDVIKSNLHSSDISRRMLAALAIGLYAPDQISKVVKSEFDLPGRKMPLSSQEANTVSQLFASAHKAKLSDLPTELLNIQDPSIRTELAGAVIRSSDPVLDKKIRDEATEVLKLGLKSPLQTIRAAAAAGLATAKTPEAARLLIGLSALETEPMVRQQIEVSVRTILKDLKLGKSFSENVLELTSNPDSLELVEAGKHISSAIKYGLDESVLRVPPRLLKKIIESQTLPRTENQEHVIVIISPADDTGAFNLAVPKLWASVNKGARISMIEPKFEQEIYDKTKHLQKDKVSRIIRAGHSSATQMSIKDPDPANGSVWADRTTVNVSDEKRARANGFGLILRDNGVVTIIGCSAAEGLGFADNLANSDWRLFSNASLLEASSIPVNVFHIGVSALDRTIFTSGNEFSYFLRRTPEGSGKVSR